MSGSYSTLWMMAQEFGAALDALEENGRLPRGLRTLGRVMEKAHDFIERKAVQEEEEEERDG